MIKDAEIYEKYRKRLIKNKEDKLLLEIYETFGDTEFIHNVKEFEDILETKNDKYILKKLNKLQTEMTYIKTTEYTKLEKVGYYFLLQGYIFRLKSRCGDKKELGDKKK